jgi:hypothetical protein
MPDTGAPWNIPYAAPADLVRVWPALSEDVADAVALGLTAANIAIGPNVVQTVKSDTFTTTSTAFTDITGFTVTITPTSATSKVLVIANLNIGNGGSEFTYVKLRRDSTDLFIGDTAGNRIRSTAMSRGGTETSAFHHMVTATFLDSPGVATATTYGVQMRVTGNTGTFNRSGDDADSANRTRTASSITVIEVAA